ncbi:GAF domain-containing protein [Microbacterium ulmi]|uniref:GAF domain-containing protein n=1 Tax=Microbacterium ulmi TaxID=179095 RepID=A0A7Y2Q0E9_9MICO|nr:GAF domain-containing protein [Microbacterium ulmi]NII69822.1 GAF domain-containing protein [Microbacterium ulmi]NNH03207.1 GAF domain-containing protein [Microbacterium ulmi]
MDGANAVAQDRLRDLLRATTSVVEHLDLEVVLTAVVDAARSLAGARYGALGVLGRDGGLERFIHRGLDVAAVHAIGHLPHGLGLLGAVIEERHPVRLEHVRDDPRSAGFPAHHPPMDSFLGVPIRVRDAVYGNLYLTDAAAGAFTEQDEELVVALAATAGIAIENARLYAQTRAREAWTAALADVLGALLDTTGEDALEIVVDRIGPLVGAQLVTLAVPLRDGTHLRVTSARGAGADAVRGRVYPTRGSLAGHALTSRRAAHVARLPEASLSDVSPAQGPTVALPLFSGEEPLGVLTVSRPADAPEFDDADFDMAFVFAGQAGVAIEVVRGRDDRRRLDGARRRVRIARDLHDHVIQRLYGAGLALQASPATPNVVDEQVEALDAAIRELRTVILALGLEEPTSGSLRERLISLVAEASDDRDAAPSLRFSGAVDILVPPDVADDIAVLTAKALATAGPLDLVVSVDDAIVVRVQGEEVGDLASSAASSAASHGGTSTVVGEDAASVLTWTVPLSIGRALP